MNIVPSRKEPTPTHSVRQDCLQYAAGKHINRAVMIKTESATVKPIAVVRFHRGEIFRIGTFKLP